MLPPSNKREGEVSTRSTRTSPTSGLEAAAGTVAVPLPVGDLIVLNNTFWLHGRAAFERDPLLHRELLRQRGYFSP